MKICIFTNHFYPEDFKVNDIAFELIKKDYEITVITAIPDYPQGKFYSGYSFFKRRREIVNGAVVIRLPIIPRGKGNRPALFFNYISYFLSVFFFTLFHAVNNKYDAVFVHLTSPFFVGIPAVILKHRQKIPLVFWALDLWPESLSSAGGIKNRLFLGFLTKIVRYVYSNCDKILIGSHGFKNSICGKGDFFDKLVYFPNWAETIVSSKEFYEYQQIEPFVNFDKNDFIILFTGNIGEAQNLDCVLDVAAEFKNNTALKFVFIGDGRRKEDLVAKMNILGLSKSVFFTGRFPLDSMPGFMKLADVLFVSLKDEYCFNLTVPSKVQFYMSQGKPILAMLNGDGADLIREAQCGITVPANDSAALKTAIDNLLQMPKEVLINFGTNGGKYYDRHFRKEQRIDQLCNLLNNINEKI